MQRRLCGSADGAARLRLGASRRSAPTQGNEVGGECAAAPIENPHQRPCRPCPRMTRIHANKTKADKLLYSSPFAAIRIIRGQNFRFTSLAPAHVALRAALRQGWFAFLPECLTLRATHVAYRANPRLLGSQPAPAGMCSPLRSGCLVRSRSAGFGLPSAGYPASARWHVFRFPVSPFSYPSCFRALPPYCATLRLPPWATPLTRSLPLILP